jgi:hypothetical protein
VTISPHLSLNEICLNRPTLHNSQNLLTKIKGRQSGITKKVDVVKEFTIIEINGVPHLDGPEGIYYDMVSDQFFILKSKKYAFNPFTSRYNDNPPKVPKYKIEYNGISMTEWNEFVTSGETIAFICEL